MGKVIKVSDKAESPVSDICWNCKNFNSANPAARTCSAFPSGIPSAIWNGENDHTKPYPGDHGIRFDSLKSKIAA